MKLIQRALVAVAVLVGSAIAIRLAWELLQPVLIPVGLLVMGVFTLAIATRLIWYYTGRY